METGTRQRNYKKETWVNLERSKNDAKKGMLNMTTGEE
jgi:hypothetical protein